ncbi:MAG: hypothetical protein R3A46_21505 [Thermomicrobiales bacterium]
MIDRKIAALRAHDSQLGANFERLEKMVRGWMSETGERHGVEYAEEFHVAQNRAPTPTTPPTATLIWRRPISERLPLSYRCDSSLSGSEISKQAGKGEPHH